MDRPIRCARLKFLAASPWPPARRWRLRAALPVFGQKQPGLKAAGPNRAEAVQWRSYVIGKREDMKHSGLLLLVAASACWALSAAASTRPHYGGTLRVAMREAPATLWPHRFRPPGSGTRRSGARGRLDRRACSGGR